MDFTTVFLIGALCAGGLFHEYLACAAGLVLVGYLLFLSLRKKVLTFYLNISSVAVVTVAAGYLISILYAGDKGSAAIGFFKFLPLLLFLLVLMQQKKTAAEYLQIVPPLACVMTVVSVVLMQVPVLAKWFSVSGRAAGFFQYSNTFALFLLIAFVLTAAKEKLQKIDYFYISVFICGILFSGSRTVFVLTAVALLAVIAFGKSRKNKIIFSVFALAAVTAAVLYASLSGDFDTVGRFLTLSLEESTFVGRLLYFADALPVVVRHPFGLGYLGYYYMQQSFQTGIYSVKFIHNDFLQLLLDIGFVPAILLAAAILRSFFKKGTGLSERLLLLLVTVHSCFDFDLQFVAVFMLFVMLFDYREGRKYELRALTVPTVLLSAVLSLSLLYVGSAQALSYFKKYDLAAKIYPWDTLTQIHLLEKAELTAETQQQADLMIENNAYISAPYNKKAQIAYMNGNFEKVIEYKQQAIALAPFSYETQVEYCRMLINGITLYRQIGDTYSADICRSELLKTVEAILSADDRLSELGKKIEEQPVTSLPEDIAAFLQTAGVN